MNRHILLMKSNITPVKEDTMEELNKNAREAMIALKQRKAAQLLEEMDLEDWDL